MPSPESDPVTTPSPFPHDGKAACDFCGAPPDPDRALEIAVRPGREDAGSPRAVALRFCDSGHAAGFFAQGRLTEVRVPETWPTPAPPHRGVDLVLVALVAAFLVSLTLILIGCWQVAQWVLA